MKRPERIEACAAFLARLSDDDLRCTTTWPLCRKAGIGYQDASDALARERLKRGHIDTWDLTPAERRRLVDEQHLDLQALAAGPIMDVAHLYLPLGRITLAEAIERERATVLPIGNGRLTDSSAKPSVLSKGGGADVGGSVTANNGNYISGGGCDG